MITATRRIQFCSGHRVYEHGSKCRHLHGHNYVVFLKAVAPQLDKLGMVIDFGVLKEKIGSWIDQKWDHGFIIFDDDQAAMVAIKWFETAENSQLPSGQSFTQKVYGLPYNPTAENLAKYLLWISNDSLLEGTGVRLCEVTIWETENCFATVTEAQP